MIDEIIKQKQCVNKANFNFKHKNLHKTINTILIKTIINRFFSDVFFLININQMFTLIINTIKNSTIKIDIQIINISIIRVLIIKTMIIIFNQINSSTIRIKIDFKTLLIFRHRNDCKLSLISILRRILRTINKTRQIRSCLTISDNYFVFVQIKTTTISRALTNVLIKHN